MTQSVLRYYKLDSRVPNPHFATAGSACFDISFYAYGKTSMKKYNKIGQEEDIRLVSSYPIIILEPNERALFPTGLIFDIPEGYSLRFHPRSGLAIKKGVTLANCEGIVDCDYRIEAFIPIINLSQTIVGIREGDRLAQAELVKINDYALQETFEQPKQTTDRTGGFGSTGIGGGHISSN